MRTLKTLAAVFCFCGLIASCGNEPKSTTQEEPPIDLKTEVAPAVTEAITEPVSKDTSQTVLSTAANPEKNPKDLDKTALAAKEANEIKKDESTKSDKVELTKEELAQKKRRAKRREKRKAERKKKEAEKRKKAKSKSSGDKPVLSFKKTIHKYGRISQGEKIKHNFVFTNTGNSELIISDAKASCGCTKPSFPFLPIPPGEEGYIGVVFDSKGKLGRQKPVITITTNADPATYDIYLEGTVDSEEIEEEKEDGKTN